MKFCINVSSTVIAMAALSFSSQVRAESKVVLVEEHFEKPDGALHRYPPASGEEFTYNLMSGASPVGGWSEGGMVALTYAAKIGTKDSGGLNCKLEKGGGTYAQLSIEAITFPGVGTGNTLKAEAVNGLKISFAAKIPKGEELEVYLSPVVSAGRAEDAYVSRIVFPNITGTGAYVNHVFTVKSLPKDQVEGFLTVLNSELTSGSTKASFNLCLKLGQRWPEGASFQLDDVVVGLEMK